MDAFKALTTALSIILAGVVWNSGNAKAANILLSAIYGEGSHFLAMSAIGRSLVDRGHNVTFLISSAYEDRAKDPRFSMFSFEMFAHPVPLEEVREMFHGFNKYAFEDADGQFLKLMDMLMDRFVNDCRAVITDEKLMHRLEVVDAIVMDVAWACGFYIQEMLKQNSETPKKLAMVAVAATPTWSGFLEASGSGFNHAYQPESTTAYSNRMTFVQRLKNVLIYAFYRVWVEYTSAPPFREMGKSVGLPNSIHPVFTISNFDLFLLSVDGSSDFPMPTSPNLIRVGGLTVTPPTFLSQELEDFVQSSGEHGVVVFSLGTYLASITVIRPDLVRMFSDAFAKLPQKVIWQLKELPDYDLPPNVKTMPWLPQNDLLGHPKTRAFMYQGGNNGFQEASYHGVPVVVIPLHGDQYDVAARIEARGMGKKIDKQDLSTELIYETLTEVTNNPSYTTVAKKVSAINKDQPMRAPERAAFWIEHVIKFGGDYMRSPANELNFFQYHLIDVIAFLIAVFVAVLLVLFFTLRFCLRLCCRMIGWGGPTKSKKD
ncbi:UDP-glucuronosyltransferase 2B1-like isoform X2 [Diadema antillarum]|uniref:UDP-glucuronosyltransferase 2B1-like isoform X2 n=1 Tax=Diadema antillarum TaxID=105358 RepID=UPI003A8372E7